MPRLTQGDIFQTARHAQLTVVFGHIGFNAMAVHWRRFSHHVRELSTIADPFLERPRQPIAWEYGRWLWLVPTVEARGLSAVEHKAALDDAVAWALSHRVSSIATNGAAADSTEPHGDRSRAEWLVAYASAVEASHGITVELISLSDVYLAMN